LVDLTGLPNSTVMFNQILKLQQAQAVVETKLDGMPDAVA